MLENSKFSLVNYILDVGTAEVNYIWKCHGNYTSKVIPWIVTVG